MRPPRKWAAGDPHAAEGLGELSHGKRCVVHCTDDSAEY